MSLTSSAVDPRLEFVMIVMGAVAGAEKGSDAETVGAILASVTTVSPSTYGATTTTLNRAYTFLLAWRDLQTDPRRYRVAERAASSLAAAGATNPSASVS